MPHAFGGYFGSVLLIGATFLRFINKAPPPITYSGRDPFKQALTPDNLSPLPKPHTPIVPALQAYSHSASVGNLNIKPLGNLPFEWAIVERFQQNAVAWE
jgi:hypothetical protein